MSESNESGYEPDGQSDEEERRQQTVADLERAAREAREAADGEGDSDIAEALVEYERVVPTVPEPAPLPERVLDETVADRISALNNYLDAHRPAMGRFMPDWRQRRLNEPGLPEAFHQIRAVTHELMELDGRDPRELAGEPEPEKARRRSPLEVAADIKAARALREVEANAAREAAVAKARELLEAADQSGQFDPEGNQVHRALVDQVADDLPAGVVGGQREADPAVTEPTREPVVASETAAELASAVQEPDEASPQVEPSSRPERRRRKGEKPSPRPRGEVSEPQAVPVVAEEAPFDDDRLAVPPPPFASAASGYDVNSERGPREPDRESEAAPRARIDPDRGSRDSYGAGPEPVYRPGPVPGPEPTPDDSALPSWFGRFTDNFTRRRGTPPVTPPSSSGEPLGPDLGGPPPSYGDPPEPLPPWDVDEIPRARPVYDEDDFDNEPIRRDRRERTGAPVWGDDDFYEENWDRRRGPRRPIDIPPFDPDAPDDYGPDWQPSPPTRQERVGRYEVNTGGMDDYVARNVRLILENVDEHLKHHAPVTDIGGAMSAGIFGEEGFDQAFWAIRDSLCTSTDPDQSAYYPRRHNFDRGTDVGMITHSIVFDRFKLPRTANHVKYELWAWPTDDPRVILVERRGKGKRGEIGPLLWADVIVTPADGFDRSNGKIKGPSKFLCAYINDVDARNPKLVKDLPHEPHGHDDDDDGNDRLGLVPQLRDEEIGITANGEQVGRLPRARRHVEENLARMADERQEAERGLMDQAKINARGRMTEDQRRIAEAQAAEARAKVYAEQVKEATQAGERVTEARREFEGAETLKPLETAESERILAEAIIAGAEYEGQILTADMLRDEGLMPQHRLELDGAAVNLSPVYELAGGRQAVVAYVEKDNEITVHSYYRSNSAGVWRYLPRYATDPHVHYSKGYGEESLNAPMVAQKALKGLSEAPPLSVSNSELVFFGTVGPDDRDRYFNEVDPTPQKLTGIPEAAHPALAAPDQLILAPEQAPNFSEPLATWQQELGMYGKVRADVFPSRDGKMKYLFYRDKRDRAWIGKIETAGAVGTTGLRESWVTGADLATPAFEYDTQTGGYGNSTLASGSYVDMYENYLSKVPVIQEYMAASELLIKEDTKQEAKAKKEKEKAEEAEKAREAAEKKAEKAAEQARQKIAGEAKAAATDMMEEARRTAVRQVAEEAARNKVTGEAKMAAAGMMETAKLTAERKIKRAADLRTAEEAAQRAMMANLNQAPGPTVNPTGGEAGPNPGPVEAESDVIEGDVIEDGPERGTAAAYMAEMLRINNEVVDPDNRMFELQRLLVEVKEGLRQMRESGQTPPDRDALDAYILAYNRNWDAVTAEVRALREREAENLRMEREFNQRQAAAAEEPKVREQPAIGSRPVLDEAENDRRDELDHKYGGMVGELINLDSVDNRRIAMEVLVRDAKVNGFVVEDPSRILGVAPINDARSEGFVEELEERAELFGLSRLPQTGESERAKQLRLRQEAQETIQ